MMHYDVLPITDTMRAEDIIAHLEQAHRAQVIGADQVPLDGCYEFLSLAHMNVHMREALRRREDHDGRG